MLLVSLGFGEVPFLHAVILQRVVEHAVFC